VQVIYRFQDIGLTINCLWYCSPIQTVTFHVQHGPGSRTYGALRNCALLTSDLSHGARPMGRIPYRNLLELRIFPRAPMRIAAANCAYSIPLNRLLRKVRMAGRHNDVALSGTGNITAQCAGRLPSARLTLALHHLSLPIPRRLRNVGFVRMRACPAGRCGEGLVGNLGG
jgi:hypothetical protein